MDSPEVPLAYGKPLKVPESLYIPPNALRVFLEHFEGPLDLLLYLIRKNRLPILEISISKVTTQYIEYVRMMRQIDLELAAEYLLMAAILAKIKSRMLLPSSRLDTDEDEEDPSAQLIARLKEYERFKRAAGKIDLLPRFERDFFTLCIHTPEVTRPLPSLVLEQLTQAFRDATARTPRLVYELDPEPLSVHERTRQIIVRLGEIDGQATFSELFEPGSDLSEPGEQRASLVVTFLALLELWRTAQIEIRQEGREATVRIQREPPRLETAAATTQR